MSRSRAWWRLDVTRYSIVMPRHALHIEKIMREISKGYKYTVKFTLRSCEACVSCARHFATFLQLLSISFTEQRLIFHSLIESTLSPFLSPPTMWAATQKPPTLPRAAARDAR